MLEFCRDFWRQKLESMGYKWCSLHDPMFSIFNRTPTCRQTDGQTDRHTTTTNTRAN